MTQHCPHCGASLAATTPAAVVDLESGQATIKGATVYLTHKPAEILYHLLQAAPHFVKTAKLVDLLWGDMPPSDPAGAVRSHMPILRRKLAEIGVNIESRQCQGYRLVL